MKIQELNKILEDHNDWLNDKTTGRMADLSYVNLSRADLRGANLRDANLLGVNLRRANLSHAELQDADLRGADLSRANLEDANLSCANLTYAKLEGANLEDAYLRGAILNNTLSEIIHISPSKHPIYKWRNQLQIGCKIESIGWWLEKYVEIGTAEGYTEDQIKEYGRYIEMLAEMS